MKVEYKENIRGAYMNIVLFTHGKVNPNDNNGMSRTIYYQCKYLRKLGHRCEIFTVVDGINKPAFFKRDEYVDMQMFPRFFPNIFKFKHFIKHWKSLPYKVDIVHFHLMWMLDKDILSMFLNKNNIPYVVTTHAAYSPYKTRKMWYKKGIAKYVYELRFLNNAGAIHALANEQGTELIEYGIKKPIFVAQNGIELSDIPTKREKNYFVKNPEIDKSTIKLLWVGIVQPFKNIDAIIKAISLLPLNEKEMISLIIVGPDKKNYIKDFKKLSKKLGVHNRVHFVGPLYGQDKYNAIESCDVYIQPSWVEGSSFAILDALACGKPSILSRNCKVSYFYRDDFFEMVEPYPQDIARGISVMISRKSEFGRMGKTAKAQILSRFNWENIVKIFEHEYNNIISTHNN